MNKSLTGVMLGLLFGITMFVLSFNAYAGILTNNNVTVGSDIQTFRDSLSPAFSQINGTAEELTEQSGWRSVGSGLTSTLEYIAIGWNAMDIFFSMPAQLETLLESVKGNVTWIDESIYAVITTSVIILIFAMIVKSKKTTSEVA